MRVWRTATRIATLAALAFGVPHVAQAAPRAVRPQPAFAQALGETAQPDPAVRSLILPNGLRVLVMHAPNPANGVSLRFYVRAGSAEETERERGAAHLLEHMTFEGSRHFPGDALDRAFQEAGVSLGRDQNAFTDFNGVDYVLDLQEAQHGKLDLALTWLRDVADGLTLDPAAIERQKSVVTAEYNARRNGSSELGEIINTFMGPGLLGVRRSPGGSPESIAALDAPTLRAFHDRWYRPDRALLIVVGDIDPAAVIAKIEAGFSTWRADGPSPPDPDRGGVDPKRTESLLTISIPNFAQGLVEVCSAAPRDTPQPVSAGSWREEGADAVWMLALQERLTHLALAPDAPFLSAKVARPDAYRTVTFTCVSLVPKPERWRDSLQVIQDETRRLAEHGVTPAEADRGRDTLATLLQTNASAAESRRSEQIAAGLLAFSLDGRTPVSPAEQNRAFTLAAPSLTAEEATQAFRRRWSASKPLVLLASTTPASQAELASAWAQAKAAPAPSAPRNDPPPVWAYASFGTHGRVVERQVMHDPDFVRLRFENGVRLNFKQAAFTRDRVDIRVRFGAGQQEVPSADLAAALLGARTFTEGGLGALDAEQVTRVFRGRVVGAEFAVERTRFVLAGATRPKDIDAEAQLLAAYLSDPGFRPESDLQAPTIAKLFYKSRAVEPSLAARVALDQQALLPHVFDPPPEAEFAALRATDFRRVLHGPLTRDALEVTVVGDIDEAAAVHAIAATLGALPARKDAEHIRADAPVLRYPAAPPSPIRTTHEGLDAKAVVTAAWPLFPWQAERQLEIRQLTLLREVFSDELRREIRERLGQTYTPQVALDIPYGGDQCAMLVSIETSPQAADSVAAAVQAIAARLAAGGVATEVLERVRRPLLDDTARRKETNAWWVSTLDGSWTEPYKLAQARTWRYDYATIGAAAVQQSATRWLGQRPLVAIALPKGLEASTPTRLAAKPPETSAR